MRAWCVARIPAMLHVRRHALAMPSIFFQGGRAMNIIDRKNQAAARLEAEHGAFRASVREIQAELDRRQQSRDLIGGGETLLAEIDTFRERLIRHFRFEESGWSRPEVAARCTPSTRRWIATLTRQHEDFLTRIDAIVGVLETALETGAKVPERFGGELSSLLADLTRHEFSESRLYQRAVFEDLGGFD